MIRTAALCLAIISLTGPAVAAELHNGRCHMDYCSWFSIEEKDLVSSNPSGALFKVTTRGWSSHHPNGSYNRRTRRTGGESTASFVFCSKDRPALIFQDESKWVAHTLAPGVQNAVYGYNESAYKQYLCGLPRRGTERSLCRAAASRETLRLSSNVTGA